MTFVRVILRGWLVWWMLVWMLTSPTTNQKIKSTSVKRTILTTTRGPKTPPRPPTTRVHCPSVKDSRLTCIYKMQTKEGECRWEGDKESSLYNKTLKINKTKSKIFDHSVTFPLIPNVLHRLDVCLVLPASCPEVCLKSEVVSDAFLSDNIKNDSLEIKYIDESKLILIMKSSSHLNQIKLSNITLKIIQPHSNQIVFTRTLTNEINDEIIFKELNKGLKYRLELWLCNAFKCNQSETLHFATPPGRLLVDCTKSTPNYIEYTFEDEEKKGNFGGDQIKFDLEFQMNCDEKCPHHPCPMGTGKSCGQQYFTEITNQANNFTIRIQHLKPSGFYGVRFRKYTSIDDLENPTTRVESVWSEITCSTKVGKPQLVECRNNVLEVNENLTEIKITQPFSQNEGPLRSILLILKSINDKFDETPCLIEIPLFNTTHIKNVHNASPRKLEKCQSQRVTLQNGPKCVATTANDISIYHSRSYSMLLRAYTSLETFTDSKTFFFEITHDHKVFIIFMITITTILVFIIIILLTCIYYYKKKNDAKIISPRKKKTLTRPCSSFGRFIATKTSRLSSYISHPIPKSKPVRLDDFLEMEEQMNKDSGLKFTEEFEDLRHVGKEQSAFTSKRNINSPKNRYANILPYEASRVELPMLEGDDSSDYINANWIHRASTPVESS